MENGNPRGPKGPEHRYNEVGDQDTRLPQEETKRKEEEKKKEEKIKKIPVNSNLNRGWT